jgi:hypothetical protein
LVKRLQRYYLWREYRTTLDAKWLLSQRRACRASFLRGAYRRFHDEHRNMMVLSMTPRKVALLARLLRGFGATQIKTLREKVEPNVVSHVRPYAVYFVAPPRLAKMLGIRRHASLTKLSSGWLGWEPSSSTIAKRPAWIPLVQARTRALPKATPALAEMLGMADEYISRFDYYSGKPRPGLVEHFYPSEHALSAHYRRLMTAYGKQSGQRFAPRLIRGQGHYDWMSPKLAKIINGFYRLHGKLATLDRKWIVAQSRTLRERYVLGVYRRYQQKGQNLLRMANAGSKMKTVAAVLRSLGCKRAVVLYRSTIPTGVAVYFEPPAALARRLGVVRRVSLSRLMTGQFAWKKAPPTWP